MNADDFWDYCHLPENKERFLDLSRGRIVEWRRPTARQGVLATNIGFVLHQYAERVGVGYASVACGITLGTSRETVRGMSVGYFTDIDFTRPDSKWDGTPPRAVALCRGPEDSTVELHAAIADFHEYGTPLVWLIDVHNRSVEVHLVGEPVSVLSVEDTLRGGGVMPGFECPISALFQLHGERRGRE